MSVRAFNGAIAGIAGGIPFGIMMTLMGNMRQVAALAGSESPVFGWLMHLTISAIIGLIYSILVHRLDLGRGGHLLAATVYGAIWWLLGPMTLMPLMMGMPLGWSAGSAAAMMPSLIGHLTFGVLLGWFFERLRDWEGRIDLVKA